MTAVYVNKLLLSCEINDVLIKLFFKILKQNQLHVDLIRNKSSYEN